MNHTHIIVDSGKHFIIDPLTRSISYEDADKLILIQNDHNSERYTFDIPKVIEGHEVLSSDKIEIHYTNESYDGVYQIEDAAENGDDKISFSWLISSNATQYVGSLIFVVKIKCLAEDGTVEYAWSTMPFKGVRVLSGISNSETVVETYADVLEQLKREAAEEAAEKAKPVKGRDYFTEEEINQIQEEVSEGAIGEFKQTVDSETSKFDVNTTEKLDVYNTNAESKLTDYNTNSTEKLDAYNSNAESKLLEYNANATEKLNEYSGNAESKLSEYNANDSDKSTAYNTNAENKLSEYNNNAQVKLDAYNRNDSDKTASYNSNADTKIVEYNDNAESKLAEYNDNATTKIVVYDDYANAAIVEYNTNAYNKAQELLVAYNDNADAKIVEYNANADNKIAEFDTHTEQIQTDINGLKSDIVNKLPKSPTDWEQWTAEEQAMARARIGIKTAPATPIIDITLEEETSLIDFDVDNLSGFRIEVFQPVDKALQKTFYVYVRAHFTNTISSEFTVLSDAISIIADSNPSTRALHSFSIINGFAFAYWGSRTE